MLSGGDDGALKIWDLRQFKSGPPVATFKQHVTPMTSVEWHPQNSGVFTASGADNQITQWDLAAERDSEAGDAETVDPGGPAPAAAVCAPGRDGPEGAALAPAMPRAPGHHRAVELHRLPHHQRLRGPAAPAWPGRALGHRAQSCFRR